MRQRGQRHWSAQRGGGRGRCAGMKGRRRRWWYCMDTQQEYLNSYNTRSRFRSNTVTYIQIHVQLCCALGGGRGGNYGKFQWNNVNILETNSSEKWFISIINSRIFNKFRIFLKKSGICNKSGLGSVSGPTSHCKRAHLRFCRAFQLHVRSRTVT